MIVRSCVTSTARTDLTDLAPPLLARARAGDPAALGELLDLYHRYLVGVAGGELPVGLNPKTGPLDVVQDTFLEAIKLFNQFRGETGAEMRAWLRAILLNKLSEVYNRYYTVKKRNASREQSLNGWGQEGWGDDLPGNGETPSRVAVAHEQADTIQAALNELPPLQRQVIVWRVWDDLPFSEIGQRMGRSMDAARMLFGRALCRLQRKMKATEQVGTAWVRADSVQIPCS